MTTKENTVKDIIETAIAKRGARIISFFYGGKPRNVLVGYDASEQGLGDRVWGERIGRATVRHKGRLYLTAKTNNENGNHGHAFKSFRLENIDGLKCR